MTAIIDPLVLDLVEWVAREPRAYADVMDAWRTSCPRLTVWEDAVDRGLVACERAGDGQTVVRVTPTGLGLLAAQGRNTRPHPIECPGGPASPRRA